VFGQTQREPLRAGAAAGTGGGGRCERVARQVRARELCGRAAGLGAQRALYAADAHQLVGLLSDGVGGDEPRTSRRRLKWRYSRSACTAHCHVGSAAPLPATEDVAQQVQVALEEGGVCPEVDGGVGVHGGGGQRT
jgi:hypothetical protein